MLPIERKAAFLADLDKVLKQYTPQVAYYISHEGQKHIKYFKLPDGVEITANEIIDNLFIKKS